MYRPLLIESVLRLRNRPDKFLKLKDRLELAARSTLKDVE